MSATADSIEAATAAMRAAGVQAGEPRLLHEGSSVIVGFGPGLPVARVGGLTAGVRDLRANYAREVSLARYLTACRAPVARPWEPPGPFLHDGRVVSLWHEAETELPASASEAGEGLRRCHQALQGFPDPLPPLTGLFDEAERIINDVALETSDRRIFQRAFEYARGLLDHHELPVQPLHGDAGLGNVLSGGVWHDWEDACQGPIIWDLAALVSTARITGARAERAEATLRAYGQTPGLDSLDAFVALRGLQVAAWSLLASATARQMRSSTETRLSWLRTYPWRA